MSYFTITMLTMTNSLKNSQITLNILNTKTLSKKTAKNRSNLTSDGSFHCISCVRRRDSSDTQTTQLFLKCCACQTWQKPTQWHTEISVPRWENLN